MSIDKIVQAIDDSVDREINLFNTRLESIFKKVEQSLIIQSVESFADPLEFDFVFTKVLQDAGYYDLINETIDNSYDKSYDDILRLFAESGLDVVFTEDDLSTILELKTIDIQNFVDIGSSAAQSLKADLYKYSISNLDKPTMVQNMTNALADTDLVKYSKTYVESGINNFHQSVIDLKSEGVTDEVYIYRGVSDSKTRKFCKCLADQNKYYDKSDASSIRSDKRRKWNCRHKIVPVSLKYAQDRKYKKGSFTC